MGLTVASLLSVVVIRPCLLFVFVAPCQEANDDAKRLYDDLLLKHGYNRLIRPVGNNSDKLVVKMGIRLSQLIDIDEKNQIMTTNVWLRQEWTDHKLTWRTAEYGGVDHLYVPSENIWLPDIILYNKWSTSLCHPMTVVILMWCGAVAPVMGDDCNAISTPSLVWLLPSQLR
ncbi:Acetylcholine receptor subunit alpha-like 1 [Bulinus truncatus]|nr:Acetylcholine receptor subunit alpha-like 1 [Bulinus truncatus]